MGIRYSVIIPHFNSEASLECLLDSIPDRCDIEVLVVDDRSQTDKSKGLVERSKLRNARWFLNDRVKSAGTCRNIGLENAVGEYLVFADSDDVFTDKAFGFIDEAISKSPNCDILFFNVTSVDVKGGAAVRHIKNRALVMNYIGRSGDWYEERLRLMHYVPWGKVIRRKLVEDNDIKFDQTIIANDGVFSLKVGKAAAEIAVSKKVIYCVTSSSESLTRKKDVDRFRVRLEVYARYFNLLSESERSKIRASPLPLVYMSLSYGLKEFVRTLVFLRSNDVKVFRYFDLNLVKFRRLVGK